MATAGPPIGQGPYSPSLDLIPTSKLPLTLPPLPSPLHLLPAPSAPSCLGETTIRALLWTSASKLRLWCSLSTCSPHLISRHRITRPHLQQRSSLEYLLAEFPSAILSIPISSKSLFSSFPNNPPPSMNGSAHPPSPAPGSKASPSLTVPTKRKRSGGAKYYAVKKGFKPGLYYSWNDCLAQVTGFKGAICE